MDTSELINSSVSTYGKQWTVIKQYDDLALDWWVITHPSWDMIVAIRSRLDWRAIYTSFLAGI